MKSATGVSLALLALGTTLACARATTTPNLQSEETGIRALDRQVEQAVAARDAAAVAAFYATDAQLLPPNAPMVTGQAGIRSSWEEFFRMPNLSLTFSPTRIDVSSMGDMAADVGTYQMSFDGPGGRVNDTGKYHVVWRKAGAEWKIASEAWNTDQPMPEPHTVAVAPLPAEGDAMEILAAGGLKWSPLEVPGFKPGIQMTAIHGDPSKEGDYTLRLRFPDGYNFPSHWHPKGEHVTVIRGTFRLGMGAKEDAASLQTYGPGDFIYIPGKMPHFGGAKGVTEIQLHGIGPFEIKLSSEV
jgi:uncharacterized protein (TIGR02246 family)